MPLVESDTFTIALFLTLLHSTHCIQLRVASSANFRRQVGRSGKTLVLLGYRLAVAGRGRGNESQACIASMLTVLRLIS